MKEITNAKLIRIIAQVENDYLADKVPSSNPFIAILGGQPASGKSLLINEIVRKHSLNEIVIINGDLLRRFHPEFKKMMIKNDKEAAVHTQFVANLLSEHLKKKALERKLSVIVEGTMRDPTVSLQTALMFKSHGYKVDAHIKAVCRDVSVLGIYKRDEAQRVKHGYGRFSDLRVHDQAYIQLPNSADQLAKSGNVDPITIYDKTTNPIYHGEHVNGQWRPFQMPSTAINSERNTDNLSLHDVVEIATDWAMIIGLQRKRRVNDQLPGGEYRRFLNKFVNNNERAKSMLIDRQGDISIS